MQGCKRAWSTLAHLVFGKIKSPTYCAKAQEYTLAHCLLAPLKKFPSSDANPVHPPLAELCVPCVPSDTETEKQPPQSQFPQNHPRPPFCPQEAPCGRFPPQVGERPAPPGQRPVRATQGPVWQKRKKTAQPGKQPPAQMENTPAFDLPPGERFPQKISSGERCEKRAGERPGAAHRRPVPGHFARQSRSFRDFSQASISPFSGVSLEALGSRPGSERENFPVASHFSGCRRRGQRKDEEKIWQKKI